MKTGPRAAGGAIHEVGRAGSPRIPIFRAAVFLVAAFAVANVAWLYFDWGGDFATLTFSDLSGCATATIATIAAFIAWRSESPRRRRAWGLLTLAGALWAVGEIIWTYYEVGLRLEVPFPSTADVGYLAGYVFAGIAIVVLPTAPPHFRSRVRTFLDGLLIGTSMLLVGWATFIGPIYRDESGTFLEKSIGLAYPVFDIVLAALAMFIVLRAQPGRRTTLVLLGAGLMSLAVADTAFAYLTLIDRYSSGFPTDAAWNIGYLLIALAAIRHDPTVPRPERNDQQRIGILVPYLAVILALLVAVVQRVRSGTLDTVLFWGTLAVVLVVVVRQLITLVDNLSLTRDLEAKIRDRTAELQRSEERHRSLIQNSSDVVTIIDADGVIRYVSTASNHIFGYEPDAIVGRRLVALVHRDDANTVEAYLTRFMSREGVAPAAEWRIKHGDGTWRYYESIGANLLDDPTVTGFVLNTRDISERKELEVQLRHQAFHDQLTGSANRALFRDRAEHALKRAARNRKPIAVLYLDLDNLKETNDQLGHDVGDKLLAAAAHRFLDCIRAEDTVARLGGDEFAILLIDSGGEGAAKHVAGRLLKALDEGFEINGYRVRTSASIGIALSWGRQEVDELLRNADLAMYAAKNKGKARFEVFEPQTHGVRGTP